MATLKNIPVKGIHHKPIITDLYYKKTKTHKPLVIFCHGYKGYKDWGAFNEMSSVFLEAGYALLKFNFSHNGGTLKQPIDFPDLEAFGNNNYTKELDDLDCILTWITSYKEIKHEIDTDQIFLIGHSRGGAIATIKAAEDTRIKKLVTWASVCDLNRSIFKQGIELEHWKKKGVIYITNGRTHQKMPHYIQFYTNFIEHKERLSVERAAKKITIPHLILHGDADTSVLINHAKNIHQWSKTSILIVIPNATHVFGAKQPWNQKNIPTDFKIILEHTIKFISNV